jgi:cell division septum initiation protein DivIVA
MTPDQPMTPGSFYLMRRKCGKAACHCARGHLHPAWVLTRSEAGRHKLYSVPADQRARVRQLAAAWRRYQRARARFGKQTAALLALADQLAQAQTVAWPTRTPSTKTPAR